MALEITPRDISILRSLFESRISTAAHICVHHFESKAEAAKKRIFKLKSAKLIGERRAKVSDPSILFLTAKGIKLLESNGILSEYPQLSASALQKRTRVSSQTIQHELEMMDIKAFFHLAIQSRPELQIEEFSTWPACYEFQVMDQQLGRERCVQPDAFVRVHESESDGGLSEHALFFELDRSTEAQDRLASIARCYQEYHKSGGFAVWCGGTRDQVREYPFRVLMVFKTPERRNNCAERLLQALPPVLSRVWLSTFQEVKSNPFGKIWIRPRDYRDATKGTRFDPERQRKSWAYRRENERQLLVEEKVIKLGLFDPQG
jgi:hypothetical protein